METQPTEIRDGHSDKAELATSVHPSSGAAAALCVCGEFSSHEQQRHTTLAALHQISCSLGLTLTASGASRHRNYQR